MSKIEGNLSHPGYNLSDIWGTGDIARCGVGYMGHRGYSPLWKIFQKKCQILLIFAEFLQKFGKFYKNLVDNLIEFFKCF